MVLSKQSRLLIQILLTDSKIAEKVLENLDDKEKYKICTIKENGNVVLGKTKYRWWNQLLNCQDELKFESFALKVWDSLVDSSSGTNNKAILNGLSQEIVMKSIREREYDWVVNRLYDCWKYVAQNSAGYQQNTSPEGDSVLNRGVERMTASVNEPRNIVLNIGGNKKIIPLIDSIGDTFNIAIEYGITDVKRIY